jgi:hypothetical protein
MIQLFPFTLISLIVANLVIFGAPGAAGADPWAAQLFAIPLFSGASWPLTVGDLMIVFALIMLFVEIMRSASIQSNVVYNHMASVIVMIVYVVEFVAYDRAANSVFFILTIIAAIDVIAGVAVSIRMARRDFTYAGPAGPGGS